MCVNTQYKHSNTCPNLFLVMAAFSFSVKPLKGVLISAWTCETLFFFKGHSFFRFKDNIWASVFDVLFVITTGSESYDFFFFYWFFLLIFNRVISHACLHFTQQHLFSHPLFTHSCLTPLTLRIWLDPGVSSYHTSIMTLHWLTCRLGHGPIIKYLPLLHCVHFCQPSPGFLERGKKWRKKGQK